MPLIAVPLIRIVTVLAIVIVMTAGVPARGAGFEITRVMNGGNRPDLACCVPFYVFYTPVISGGHVAFISRNGPPDGIWSGAIKSGKLTKLAGLETPAPGGTGNFSAFYGGTETAISIGGGFVTFFAADANGKLGLYAVPVTGGDVRRIASTTMRAPNGEFFTDLRRAATNGQHVVFAGASATHTTGIYRANINGKGRITLIETGTQLDARDDNGVAVPDYFNFYGTPVIGLDAIFFYASGLFDPVSGANAIIKFTDAFANKTDNATALQAGDGGHVRITALSAAAASNMFGFRADEPNSGFAGIFEGRSKDFAAKLVSTKDNVPGTQRKFTSFIAFSYDDSGTAFVATSTRAGGVDQSIYFTAGPGQPIQKVAGGTGYYAPLLGNRAVSNGRIVFMEGTNFADRVYVAIPVP